MDLFRKLTQESHESITPSSSNKFLIPITRYTFLCISDTSVKIPNLCFCIVIIMGMTNNTPTYCPLPTWILIVVEVNLGNECRHLHHKKYDFDMYDLLAPVSTNILHSVPSNNFPLV